ncbi:MAG TPA: hypothetical protein VJR05_14905, partial [Acidimicrobiia bacterium]|nr:hypothetical protein [Acidimicrobiia bacterium]
MELKGSIGPLTIPPGTVAKIVGDVTLTGDLMVEGTLTGIDTFTLDGGGHQIMVHGGGRLQLVGKAKTGWARVGDSVSGWANGDVVAIAPTAIGAYQPSEGKWGGGWGSIKAPAGVKLIDGRVLQAEVANLTRSINIKNLSRIMLHEGAGPSVLRYIRLDGCGGGELGFYPIHFHLNGNSVRGSLVEGVVVMNSPNRAFVPHGSHGVKFRDCVAYRITKRAYWWDEGPGNQSADIRYEKCLAILIFRGSSGEEKNRLAGFQLGGATGSAAIDCAAVCVQGQSDSGGFWWPGGEGDSIQAWDFRRNVSHNNQGHGYIVWQNTNNKHFLEASVAYRNARGGIHHGAYRNPYRYSNMVLQENQGGQAVLLHANAKDSGLLFENIATDGILWIDKHNLP